MPKRDSHGAPEERTRHRLIPTKRIGCHGANYRKPARIFGLSGNDRIDGRFVREALIELDGGPQCPFLVHARRQGIDDS